MTEDLPTSDRREYVRIAVDLPTHPKLAELDDPAAGWLYVVSVCYCGEHLTDGEFTSTVVCRLAGVDAEIGKRLVDADMWHEHGHDCPKCPQPAAGRLVVHDYLRHQRSRSQAENLRRAARTAADARWSGRDADRMPSASEHTPTTDLPPNGLFDMRSASDPHADRNAEGNAEVEVEGEVKKDQTTYSPSVGGSGGEPSQQAAPAAAKRKRAADRGTRLPEDWVPSPQTRDKLRGEYPNLPDDWWRRTHERFVNYWVAKTGRDATKITWERTFINWVHEQVDRDRPRGGSTQRHQSDGFRTGMGHAQRLNDEDQAEAQRQHQLALLQGGVG